MNLSTKNGILNGNRMRLNGIKDWVLCINKEGHFCYYHIRKNQFYTCVSFTDLTRHDFEIWLVKTILNPQIAFTNSIANIG